MAQVLTADPRSIDLLPLFFKMMIDINILPQFIDARMHQWLNMRMAGLFRLLLVACFLISIASGTLTDEIHPIDDQIEPSTTNTQGYEMKPEEMVDAVMDNGMGCFVSPPEMDRLSTRLSQCSCSTSSDPELRPEGPPMPFPLGGQNLHTHSSAKLNMPNRGSRCMSKHEIKRLMEPAGMVLGGLAHVGASFALMGVTYCWSLLYIPGGIAEMAQGCVEFRHEWREIQKEREYQKRKSDTLSPQNSAGQIAVQGGSCELRPKEAAVLEQASQECTVCQSKPSFLSRIKTKAQNKFEKVCTRIGIPKSARGEFLKGSLHAVSGASLIAAGVALAPLTKCLSVGAAAYGGLVFAKGCKHLYRTWRLIQKERLEETLSKVFPEYGRLDEGLDLESIKAKNQGASLRRTKKVEDVSLAFESLSEMELNLVTRMVGLCHKKNCLNQLKKRFAGKLCTRNSYVKKVTPHVVQLGHGLTSMAEVIVLFEAKGGMTVAHAPTAVQSIMEACKGIGEVTWDHGVEKIKGYKHKRKSVNGESSASDDESSSTFSLDVNVSDLENFGTLDSQT